MSETILFQIMHLLLARHDHYYTLHQGARSLELEHCFFLWKWKSRNWLRITSFCPYVEVNLEPGAWRLLLIHGIFSRNWDVLLMFSTGCLFDNCVCLLFFKNKKTFRLARRRKWTYLGHFASCVCITNKKSFLSRLCFFYFVLSLERMVIPKNRKKIFTSLWSFLNTCIIIISIQNQSMHW